MPTKRMFDMAVIVALAIHPAVGLLKMAARRWSTGDGALATAGAAVQVAS